MKWCSPKLAALAAVMLAAAASQYMLLAHVDHEKSAADAALRQPLATLPLELGEWIGQDVPIDEQLNFADDSLQRVYRHRETGQLVTLWIAYSATARDRGHHPEICMAVLGKPENRTRRAMLPVPGHDKPVQVLHFGQPGEATWACYWHYALSSEATGDRDLLQRIYHASRSLPPSVTLEVFAEDNSPDTLRGAADFVVAIDESIQPLVGPGARRGHARLPVTIATGSH